MVKGKEKGGGGKGGEEEPLKAVVVGAGWDLSPWGFTSWSIEVAGTSLLGLQLEVLSRAGVEECYLMEEDDEEGRSSSEGGQMTDGRTDRASTLLQRLGIEVRELSAVYCGMRIRIIHGSEWRSVGHALRDLDSMDSIRPRQDFILVQAGAFFSLDLASVIDEHRARRQKNNNWAMTLLFSRFDPAKDRMTIFIDEETDQLLKVTKRKPGAGVTISSTVAFGEKLDRSRLRLLPVVSATGVAICAPEILVEFRDNFDYETVSDFVNGKLEGGDEELIGTLLAARVLDSARGEYGIRINSFAEYAIASKNIIRRWSYPLVPELNLTAGSTVTLTRNKIYREERTEVARSAKLVRDVLISDGVVVEEQASIADSLLHREVLIKEGAKVENSLILGKAVVGRGARVHHSIICSGAQVGDRAKVGPGVVLGPGTIVGAGVTLPEGAWYSMENADDEEDVEEDDDDDDDDDSDEDQALVRRATMIKITDELGEGGMGRRAVRNAPDAFSDMLEEILEPSSSEGEDMDKDVRATEAERFRVEVEETITRAVLEGHDVENTSKEVSSLKMVYDRTVGECIDAIMQSLLLEAMREVTPSGGENQVEDLATQITSVKKVLVNWKRLTQLYMDEEKDQVALISAVAKFGKHWPGEGFHPLFLSTLQLLYQEDLAEEDAIFQWAEEEAKTDPASKFLFLAQPLLAWLAQASEEED